MNWEYFYDYLLVLLALHIMLCMTYYYCMQERRTRISGKLKKLQELVPNMDKVLIISFLLPPFSSTIFLLITLEISCVNKCCCVVDKHTCSKLAMLTCWIWQFNISKASRIMFRSVQLSTSCDFCFSSSFCINQS